MSDEPMHYSEELQDLLDGRLAESERAAVEAHVATCARCSRDLAALQWSKQQLSASQASTAAPADLHARIRAALDEEDRPLRHVTLSRRAWIGTSLAAAAAVTLLVRVRFARSLPERVADDFLAYVGGEASLAIESADPRAVEAYFAANGATFPTRVLDLAMMQYQVAGGRVHRLDGRVSALFAYRGPGGVPLVCQMYEGQMSELPATIDQRENNGIPFQIYQSGNVTVVFWPEGEVICVLASNIPRDEVIQLAFAKAMKPASA